VASAPAGGVSLASVGAWLLPSLKRASTSSADSVMVPVDDTILKLSIPVTVSVPKLPPRPPGVGWITNTPSAGLVIPKPERPMFRT
jgi:hypothetical protein